MLGEINPNLEPKGYELIVCKPNRTQIGEMTDVFDIKYTARFNDTDELTFSIPYFVFDNSNFQQVKNPYWDYCVGDYLILLNHEKYFIITYPTDSSNEGRDVKTLKCYSLEYELTKKKVKIDTITRMLYDASSDKAGVLNLLESQTTWKVGYLDPDVVKDSTGDHDVYRTFQNVNKTWTAFLEDVKSSFNCVFKYDTINKNISAYTSEHAGQDRDLYISNVNYMKAINRDLHYDEVYTQMNVYGKNNLTINSVNPPGTTYIENFSYYMEHDYMSEDLKNALIAYNALVLSKQGDFQGYLTQLSNLDSTLTTKQVELAALNEQLKVYKDSQYTAIKSGQSDLTTIYNQISLKETEINNKNNEIAGVQAQINAVTANIATLQSIISKESNFTTDQLKELNYYIHQCDWSNENISNPTELYESALKQMKKINIPIMEFKLDVVDFLNVVSCQYDWDKLIVGDLVTVNYDNFDIDLQVRLVSYTHEYNSNKLTLEFSNTDIKNDALRYISDVTANSAEVAGIVNTSKWHWDLGSESYKLVNDVINSDLDAGKNAVLAGQKNDITIDEYGILLKNHDNPNYQLRLLSNIFAFSDDGFQHCGLLATNEGLVGSNIFGKIIGSSKLIITNSNNSFVVDGDGMSAYNMSLTLNKSDGKSRIVLNPNDGIKIQAKENGIWNDKLYEDEYGNITCNDITCNDGNFYNINAYNGTYHNITATEMKTSNTTNYMVFHDQYTDYYRNGVKVMDVGIVENASGNPEIEFYKPNGSVYFHIWGNGDSNFATIGGFGSSITAEGNWMFSNATMGGSTLATQQFVMDYVAQHSSTPPITG